MTTTGLLLICLSIQILIFLQLYKKLDNAIKAQVVYLLK